MEWDKRQPEETYEQYKARLANGNRIAKDYFKGTVVHAPNLGTLRKSGKPKRRVEARARRVSKSIAGMKPVRAAFHVRAIQNGPTGQLRPAQATPWPLSPTHPKHPNNAKRAEFLALDARIRRETDYLKREAKRGHIADLQEAIRAKIGDLVSAWDDLSNWLTRRGLRSQI
jgi:hypothetical protein